MRLARGLGRAPFHLTYCTNIHPAETWEVETYTWDGLPEEYRGEPVTHAIARELEWTLAHLPAGAEGVRP